MTQDIENGVRVLYCHCAYADIIPRDVADAVRAEVENRGDAVVVEDLCGLCAGRDARLATWLNGGVVTVIACHPRAVRWLLAAAGVNRAAQETVLINLREQSAREALAALPPCRTEGKARVTGASREWVPWFPVIDGERCVQCGQCRDFCLFGVYDADRDGTVRVVEPRHCKNNCPACARICPHAAIMFPKFDEAPIDGAPIDDEAGVQARIRVNVDELLGSDPHRALAARQARARRLRIDRRRVRQAIEERDACRRQKAP